MSTQRRMPQLGQPSKSAERDQRREPRLPTEWVPVPARGPRLTTPATGTDGR